MANYFEMFPKILYDFSTFTDPNDILYVTNIFTRAKITQEAIQGASAYDKYIVKDGDKLEIISNKIYGTPTYHWILCMANNIFSNAYLPLSNLEFEQYVDKMYTNPQALHHYETIGGTIINPVTINGIGSHCLYDPTNGWYSININDYIAITNYEYEFNINETNRTINIVKPQFINGIISQFSSLMS